MFVEHFGRRLEVDHLRLRVHVVDIVVEARRAAAARDDDVLELRHFVQHVVLDAAESVFALLVEYLLYGAAHACLYIPVEVVERHAELLGESLSDGCLAGSHIADEDDSCHSSTSSW